MTGLTIVLDPGSEDETWAELLRAEFPEATIVGADDSVEPASVDFLVNWKHPVERILGYPNLKAMVLSSAGFDHLPADLLNRVPAVRLIDPGMSADIATYCLGWIIHFQRDFDVFAQNATTGRWRKTRPRFPSDVVVGVLGRGTIGSVVLDTVAAHGFQTIGWSRSDNDRPLLQFYADCDVVINLLPYSTATHHAVGAEQLSALDDGVLINVGRGATVDNDALLVALEGPMRAAVLDVFETEPLPQDSPLWTHPKVTVTPHIAGRTDPHTASAVVASSIRSLLAGETPAGLIHP